MPITNIPAASRRAYVLFVKLGSLDSSTSADRVQALFDSLDINLRSLAQDQEQDWFPNPYGGAIAVPTVDDAIRDAEDLISTLTADGIPVSIAIGRGRLDRVLNVNRWNVTALAMNMVARLAFLDEAQGNVVVDPVVRDDAVASRDTFRDIFGPKERGKVKRSQLEYHRITAPQFSQTQNLHFQYDPPPETSETADIICFDIERYSESTPDQQNVLVDGLSSVFEDVLSRRNCQPDGFGPAGDTSPLLERMATPASRLGASRQTSPASPRQVRFLFALRSAQARCGKPNTDLRLEAPSCARTRSRVMLRPRGSPWAANSEANFQKT
jgi:hypothetical protein